jgi:PST family polysaccharide transporter
MDARLLKSFSFTAGLRVARLFTGLLLASQLGRHLGSEGFGQLSVALATISVLLVMGELGFARYTVRQLLTSDRSEADTLGITVGARLGVSAILFGLLCAGLWLFKPQGGLLLLIYGVQLLSNPCTEIVSWFESKQRVTQAALAQFIGFFVSAVCIGAGIWLDAPLYYFAITYAVEGWTFLGLGWWWFHRAGGRIRLGAFRWSAAFSILRHSWYELASQLALILLFRIDAIMVNAIRGADEAGIYSASVRISELVYFIPTILASLYLPRMIELRQKDPARYRSRMTDYFSISLLVACGCAVTLAAAAPLIGWVFGEAFSRGAPVLAIHAWSFIPYAVGIARTQYLTVENRLWVNLPSVIGALVINVALNALWIPAHGALGAAWATLVAYSIAWVLSSFLLPGVARDVGDLLSRATWQLPRFTLTTLRQVLAAR